MGDARADGIEANGGGATSRALLITALATVFCSSAAIMLLQLVAGRLAAAYVGQSLYTWTSAIAITLAGIGIGNALGGRLADRGAGARLLGLQALVAAACVLSVLVLNPIAGVLPPLIALPWPARIFLHYTLVFLLPFLALGTISPVTARLALDAGGPAGRAIGSVFAWSITGSLLGVFVTGYFLFAWAGNRAIVVCSALVLAALGAALLATGGRRAEPAAASADQPAAGRVPLRLIVIVTVAGALVMALELATGRMLSRVYGNSLFTWTTTIGVILAALALGGRAGGRWTDRLGGEAVLTRSLIGASIVTALLPLFHLILNNFPILWDLPWPGQIFCHMVLVFFLPCFLLGMVPPAVIRLAIDHNPAMGRAVGLLYAWNSAGGILGALLTGFVLIAALGTVQVIVLTMVVCAALALYGAPRNNAARGWGILALVLGICGFVPVSPFVDVGLNLGLRPYRGPNTVFERESAYSYIAINEIDPVEHPGERMLILDKLMHNKTDLNHPLDLKYAYLQAYANVLDALYPKGAPLNTLSVGGGGYNFIEFIEKTRPGGKTVAVEIDPEVTEAAHAAFGFPRDTRAIVHHLDGRNFIQQERGPGGDGTKYDAVIGDCFSDYSVPFHLTTLEYTQGVADLLKDDGVYMLNLLDMLQIGDFLAAVVGTCEKVFPNVAVISANGKDDARETFVVVASKRPLDLAKAVEITNAQSHEKGRLLTAEELQSLRSRAKVSVLTDDFAPVENLLAPVVLKTEETTLLRRLGRADSYLLHGKPALAAAEAKKILSRSKNFPEAAVVLANAYGQLGDEAAAVAILRDLIKEHPQTPEYRDHLAVHLFRSNKPQEAIDTWGAVLADNPAYMPSRLNIGAALVQLKRYDEAEKHFAEAARLQPDALDPAINLAGLYDARGDAAGARRVLGEAAVKHPQSGEVQQQLAIVAYKAKDYNAAWDAVKAASRLGVGVPEALLRDLQRDSGRSQ